MFDISAPLVGGAHTFALASALPFLTDALIIDGTTESGVVSGVPVVNIDGTALFNVDGVRLDAGSDGSTIRGLSITGFLSNGAPATHAISVYSSNNTVAGNYVGLHPDGSIGANWAGIAVAYGSSNNLIGGTAPSERNVVSGNAFGIALVGTGTTNNRVQGNYIGVAADGVSARPNTTVGIQVYDGANNNLIGGTAPGAGNLIANSVTGLRVGYPGLPASGVSALGNTFYNNPAIDLGSDGVTPNDLGDLDSGPNGLQNFPVLASANADANGTTVVGTLNTLPGRTIRIEFFATRPSLADASGYGGGERFLGFANVTTDGSGNASFNTTFGNVWVNAGDRISATATDLGTNDTSEFAANVTATSTGIIVVDTTSDIADGATTSITDLGNARGADGRISLREAITAANNTANGATPDKIVFAIPDALAAGAHTISLSSSLPSISQAVIIDGTTEPDYAGKPMVVLNGQGSALDGLRLYAGSGGSTIRGLVVQNFAQYGIQVQASDGDVIAGNWIGLNVAGNSAAANLFGIAVGNSNGTVVGGSIAADRNVISGNGGDGILIDGLSGADGNTVRGNYIGTNASGTAAVGNGGSGIALYNGAKSNAVLGNVISGNANNGVAISDAGTINNIVRGNLIGVNAAATLALGNTTQGIWIGFGASSNTVGGTAAGEANLIGGSVYAGIELNGVGTSGNLIAGNFIGTDASATLVAGNQWGIRIVSGASNNLIGGTSAGAGNLVVNNRGAGIEVLDASSGNALLGNRVFANAGIGIDLNGDGVTPNDIGDVDSGPNGLQNVPVLDSLAVVSGGTTKITGLLNSNPNTSFRIEFFSSPRSDWAAFTYLGFIDVATDMEGEAGINAVLDVSVPAGYAVTATATVNLGGGNYGSTSEFSQNATASVNSAPVLDPSRSPTLDPIAEDAGAPVGAVGTLVSALVDFATPAGQVDNVTDANAGAQLGIAVTAADATNGTWWYSTDAGASWNALGAVSNGSARLLAADATTRLYFQPNADYNGTLASAISFRAWDQASGSNGALADTSINGGDTAFSSVTDTASLVVTAVNDPPVITAPGVQSTNEDASLVITGLSVSDVDAGSGPVEVTLTVANGTLTLAGTTGLTFVTGDGTADAGMTFRGTLAAVNAGLSNLIYAPAANYNGSATLTVSVRDSALVSLNGDPNLAARYTFGNSGSLGEDTSPLGVNSASVIGAASVSDATRGNVLSLNAGDYARVATTFGNPANVTLAAWVNLSVRGLFGSEVFSLDDKLVLRLDENSLSRGVTAFVYDGTGFQAINSGVYVAGTGWHHVAYTFDDTNDSNTLYIDGVAVASASTTASIAYAGANNTFLGKHPTSGNFDFTGKISDARVYDRALTSAEIAALASDLPLTVTRSVVINVAPVNDPPVVTTTAPPLSYTENQTATVVDAGVTVSDVDNASLSSATVAISVNYAAGQDLLAFVDQNGITGSWNAGTGVLTLSGAASVADYQTALRSVTYVNTSDAPSTATRTVSFAVNDGIDTSAAASRSIAVTAVNDAPAITSNGGGAGASVNVAENTRAVTLVTSTDVDGPAPTYSIAGGADAAKFTIDASTGALSFIVAPDFEAPTDAGANNVYDVIVQASDGSLSATQAIAVTVTDQAITSATASGASTVAAGNVYTLNLTANEDASSWKIVWGDGRVDTVAGNPSSVTHTYAAGNAGLNFNILVSATDASGTHFNNDLIVPGWLTPGAALHRYAPVSGAFTQTFGGSAVSNPDQAIVGPDGLIYVAGLGTNNIVRYDATTGALVDIFVNPGSGGLSGPTNLAFGPDGNMYVGSYGSDQVLRYDGSTGAFIDAFVTAGSGGLNGVSGIAFRPDGKLYVGSYLTGSVLRFDSTTGAFVDTFIASGSGGLDQPEAMTWGPDGNLYIGSFVTDDVKRFNGSTGAFIDAFVTSGSGGLTGPTGVVFGPDGNLYVASKSGNQVIEYDGTTGAAIGAYVTAGSGGLQSPEFINFLPSAQVTVFGNLAPTLDAAKSPALVAQSEDAGLPVGAVGTLVSSLVDFTTPAGQVDNVVDANAGAQLGLAVTAADSANGTWWYSTNAGASWNALGAVSDTSARLLAADATTRLYFQPNADYNGTLANAITFRAWDQTSGSNGALADTSANGGATAFSVVTDTASLVVTAVNDAPTITSGVNVVLAATDENTPSSSTPVNSFLVSAGWADVDVGALNGIAITAASGNGTWQYSTDGLTWNGFGAVSSTNALLLDSFAQVRYLPDAIDGETATLAFKAWDQTSGNASTNGSASYASTAIAGGGAAFSASNATASLFVTAVNDAPVGQPTINGTAAENQTLTAVTNTIADADGLGVFSYQWSRNGSPVVAATSSTYVLTSADVGMQLTVQVSYTDGHGTAEMLTSAATVPVAGLAPTPVDLPPVVNPPILDPTPLPVVPVVPVVIPPVAVDPPVTSTPPVSPPTAHPPDRVPGPTEAPEVSNPAATTAATPTRSGTRSVGRFEIAQSERSASTNEDLRAGFTRASITADLAAIKLAGLTAEEATRWSIDINLPREADPPIANELTRGSPFANERLLGSTVRSSGSHGLIEEPESSAPPDDEWRFDIAAHPGFASGALLSTGMLWWATRAGGMLAAMMASAPMWRTFDPLPILERRRNADGVAESDDPAASAGDDEADPVNAMPRLDAETAAPSARRSLLEALTPPH